MAMVTNKQITLLNNNNPVKRTWKIEVRVIHAWIEPEWKTNRYSFEYIVEDKMVYVYCSIYLSY